MKYSRFYSFMFAALLLGTATEIMPMSGNPNRVNQVQPQQCTLCLNNAPDVEFRQLTCGHNDTCVECLQDQLDRALDAPALNEDLRVQLRCPHRACRGVAGNPNAVLPLMQPGDIRIIYGDQARVERFNEVVRVLDLRLENVRNEAQFNRFLRENPDARRCPTDGCQWAYMLGVNQRLENVQCEVCHHQFCSHCRAPHRVGARCVDPNAPVQNNNNVAPDSPEERARLEQERQNREWARRNIKACPACRRNIHKYSGCNHMTCYEREGGCGHQFCWIDLEPWGIGHGDHQFGEHLNLEVQNNNPEPDIQEALRDGLLPPKIRRNYTPLYVAAGIAVAAGAGYGVYRLYKYLTAPKPVEPKDAKITLIAVEKEALRNKRLAENANYVRESFKNYFVNQEKNKGFANLDEVTMARLRKMVDDLEAAFCTGNCDQAYAALVNFIIEVNAKELAKPVDATQSAVKPTVVAPPVVVPDVRKDVPVKQTTPIKPAVKPASKTGPGLNKPRNDESARNRILRATPTKSLQKTGLRRSKNKHVKKVK